MRDRQAVPSREGQILIKFLSEQGRDILLASKHAPANNQLKKRALEFCVGLQNSEWYQGKLPVLYLRNCANAVYASTSDLTRDTFVCTASKEFLGKYRSVFRNYYFRQACAKIWNDENLSVEWMPSTKGEGQFELVWHRFDYQHTPPTATISGVAGNSIKTALQKTGGRYYEFSRYRSSGWAGELSDEIAEHAKDAGFELIQHNHNEESDWDNFVAMVQEDRIRLPDEQFAVFLNSPKTSDLSGLQRLQASNVQRCVLIGNFFPLPNLAFVRQYDLLIGQVLADMVFREISHLRPVAIHLCRREVSETANLAPRVLRDQGFRSQWRLLTSSGATSQCVPSPLEYPESETASDAVIRLGLRRVLMDLSKTSVVSLTVFVSFSHEITSCLIDELKTMDEPTRRSVRIVGADITLSLLHSLRNCPELVGLVGVNRRQYGRRIAEMLFTEPWITNRYHIEMPYAITKRQLPPKGELRESDVYTDRYRCDLKAMIDSPS
jgi:hypothetical protein